MIHTRSGRVQDSGLFTHQQKQSTPNLTEHSTGACHQAQGGYMVTMDTGMLPQ
jgi:hypothetical protein